MQEIKALKGKHFDPDVVEACVSLFELDGFTFDD